MSNRFESDELSTVLILGYVLLTLSPARPMAMSPDGQTALPKETKPAINAAVVRIVGHFIVCFDV